MAADWIPAPNNDVDLVPDGAEVKMVLYGIRRTSDEPSYVATDGITFDTNGAVVPGSAPTRYSYIEPRDDLKEVYYREADHG